MNRFTTLTLALLFLSFSAISQKYVELGGFMGIANYQGDLNNRPIEFRESKYSFGGFIKYHYGNKLHFRGQVYYARISGDDVHSEGKKKERGWSFATDMAEASIQLEWLPFAKYRFNRVGLFRPQINPFVSIGIGSSFTINKDVAFNINTSTKPEISFPEPEDKNNFLIVPVGGGIRFDFTQWTTIAGEVGWRYTRSDYLDGISRHANPDKPDWYFFFGATLSTYFGQQEDYGF
ncbi:MAG: DUF6089 family protein [Bacteroidota bacterium]